MNTTHDRTSVFRLGSLVIPESLRKPVTLGIFVSLSALPGEAPGEALRPRIFPERGGVSTSCRCGHCGQFHPPHGPHLQCRPSVPSPALGPTDAPVPQATDMPPTMNDGTFTPPGGADINFENNNLDSSFSLSGGPQSAAPDFIGDFFGVGGPSTIVVGNIPFTTHGTVATASISTIGALKQVESGNPLPRDRIFGFYDYFQNVPLYVGDVNVHRFVPGFEKTFFNGLMSFEMRVPMGVSLDSNVSFDAPTNLSNAEFGNLTFYGKTLLWQTPTFSASAGLGVSVPTADDINLISTNGLIRIQNRAIHLSPLFGALWTPNDRWFTQSILQIDVAANGNPVLSGFSESQLTPIGRMTDTPFLWYSQQAGWWLHRDPNAWLSSWSVLGEVHFNQSLQGADLVTDNPSGTAVGSNAQNISFVDMSLGTNFRWSGGSSVTVAWVTPIGGGSDRQFDGQLRVQWNKLFGRSRGSPSLLW